MINRQDDPEVPSLEEMAGAMLVELGFKRQSDPGFTSAELARAWGVCVGTAQERLSKLKGQGKIIEGVRMGKDCAGRTHHYPVYRLVEDEKD